MLKRFIFFTFSLFSVVTVSPQVLSKDSLYLIKPGSKMCFVLNFSDAVIVGMDEEALRKYEPAWLED